MTSNDAGPGGTVIVAGAQPAAETVIATVRDDLLRPALVAERGRALAAQPDARELAQRIDALAEPLARVAATV